LSGAALVDPNPDQLSIAAIHVLNLADTISDTDRFSLAAKQVGTYEYENKKGDTRVVRSYDAGRPCERNEIPDEILKGGKPSAGLPSASGIQRDMLASLPGNENLLCNGTGFFITEDGYLITNDHVVRGVHRVKVRLRSDIYDADVVKTDQDTDLALLKVNGGSFPALTVVMHKEASLGDEVFTIGFPNVDLQGIEPKYTDGRISSLAGLHDDPSQYQISVPVQPGNSGGPLVGSNGQVVGVIVARISDLAVLRRSGSIPQNVNYAIKASALREFLKSVRDLSGKMQAASTDLQKETAIKKGQAATVMVLGYR
jgi:S1-C subfamily serine protease